MPHFYERNIIEIRDEYTTFLTHILSPVIYKGIKSIYDHAVEKRKELKASIREQLDQGVIDEVPKIPSELRLFQIYLKDIPGWNPAIIERETQRARIESRCPEWFDDLIKAVVKSNVVLLTFSATEHQCDLVKQRVHEEVKAEDLIHKVYIECAKSVYNFPELLWHHYDPLEIKRNQRDLLNLVKDSIKEGIRQLLPMKVILEEFLQNDYIQEEASVEASLSEGKYLNMKQLVDRDLYEKRTRNQYEELETQKDSPVVIEELQGKELEDLQEKIAQLKDKLQAEEGGSVKAETKTPPAHTQVPTQVPKVQSAGKYEGQDNSEPSEMEGDGLGPVPEIPSSIHEEEQVAEIHSLKPAPVKATTPVAPSAPVASVPPAPSAPSTAPVPTPSVPTLRVPVPPPVTPPTQVPTAPAVSSEEVVPVPPADSVEESEPDHSVFFAQYVQ